jgi:hypothetical protein
LLKCADPKGDFSGYAALAAADLNAARTFAGAKVQGLKPKKNVDQHRHG